MKHIHFSLFPCRDVHENINPEFIFIAIVTDNGEIISKQCVRKSAWRNNESDCQLYWKHVLLSDIKDRLYKASNTSGYIFNREKCLVLEDAVYDEWYRWYYFIDGEDASDYIRRCPVSQHTTNWQARCGVIVGWKFYKNLISHDFLKSTAAMLAYARGYLTGMESNAPWDSEGLEALHCLGLSIKGGSDALRAF